MRSKCSSGVGDKINEEYENGRSDLREEIVGQYHREHRRHRGRVQQNPDSGNGEDVRQSTRKATPASEKRCPDPGRAETSTVRAKGAAECTSRHTTADGPISQAVRGVVPRPTCMDSVRDSGEQ